MSRGRLLWILSVLLLALAVLVVYLVKNSRSDAEGSVADGVSAHRAGELEKAKRLYTEALDTQPSNKFANYNLGLIAQSSGDPVEAERRYKQTLEADSKFIPAMFNLALVSEALGKNETAKKLYTDILAIEPNQAETHFNLGLLLKAKLGKPAEGDAELAKASQLNPRLTTPATSSPPQRP